MILYVATKNQGKIKEINKIMESAGITCKSFPDMEDVEETGSTFEENAKIKADFLSSKLRDEYVIADDSGLSVDALQGFTSRRRVAQCAAETTFSLPPMRCSTSAAAFA